MGFNTLMRQQVNARSTFYVRRVGHHSPLDIDQLRAALESDTPEGQALLNSVVRYAGSLRSTRAY